MENTSLLATIDQHVQDGDETALTEYLISLPADRVPHLLYEIDQRRRLFDRMQKTLEACATRDGLKAWTAPDGREFTFGAGRKRVVSAPRVLNGALLAAIPTVLGELPATEDGTLDLDHPHYKALRAAFEQQEPKVRLTQLDAFLAIDPRYKSTADDFITWEDAGPMHLRERYER